MHYISTVVHLTVRRSLVNIDEIFLSYKSSLGFE